MEEKSKKEIYSLLSIIEAWRLKHGFCSFKKHHNEYHLLLFLDSVAKHDVTWYEIPSWPVWVSCPGYVPSQLLLYP